MNRIYILLFFLLCSIGNLSAQLGYRVLLPEQPCEAFIPLKCLIQNDSFETGFGFINPTNNNSIIFSKKRPIGDKTKEWKVFKVKYVEFYNKSLLSKRNFIDSLESKDNLSNENFQVDTLKMYYLENMKGNAAKSLIPLLYENDQVRMFGPKHNWENHPRKLVYFQTKKMPAFDSNTYFLNYNSHKLFKRSAKKVFKHCSELVERIENGEFFPRDMNNLRRLADEYESLCSQN